MYRALVDVQIIFRGEPLHLKEGALFDLKDLQPSEVDFLLAAEYVEKAKGKNPKPETPEEKTPKAESR